jgi:hypothetical protein
MAFGGVEANDEITCRINSNIKIACFCFTLFSLLAISFYASLNLQQV